MGSCENSYFRKRTVAVLLQILQMTSKNIETRGVEAVKLAEHDETRHVTLLKNRETLRNCSLLS